jgi:acetolactate synthase-1/2/3 large subunit
MKICNAVLKCLKAVDVQYTFGLPAGTVSPIYDAMNDEDIKPIITKNEAGCAYMAARYSSLSGKLGVCIVAGAVGINNMINGVADAARAKSPVLIISGYVNRWQIGKGALQELDTQNILKPITKYSETILEEGKVIEALKKAIEIALTPPQGPVHISIPLDVQLLDYKEEMNWSFINPLERFIEINPQVIETAATLINNSKHGIIMIGKGCRSVDKEVIRLSEHLNWPIITTPEGKGIIPSDFYLNYGNYGYSSTDAATALVHSTEVDCILILGTSLGEASTCNFDDRLVKGRKIIHVDWDLKELDKVFKTDIKVLGDLRLVIPELIKYTTKCKAVLQEQPKLNSEYINNHTGLSLRLFLDKITAIMPQNTVYISDLGEYMNFVFKYLNIPAEGNFEVNLNYAAMGSGIAGAVGAHFANVNKTVAVFAGDGSFFMNGTEILTAKEYNLPIVYFIINNSMLAYVEHGHKFLYGRSLDGFKHKRISIAEFMNSAGVKAMSIEKIDDMYKIGNFIANLQEPCVIELITDGTEPAPIMDRLKSLKNDQI